MRFCPFVRLDPDVLNGASLQDPGEVDLTFVGRTCSIRVILNAVEIPNAHELSKFIVKSYDLIVSTLMFALI